MLNFDDYKETGLYLIFHDGAQLRLTPTSISFFTHAFLEDPEKVPPRIKQAVDFQACSICPKAGSGEFCHALYPTLPYIDTIDQYESHSPVTVIYRDKARNSISIEESTLREALSHISVLSLIHYCEVGQQYRDFFMGVTPVMEFEEVVNRIYLNIFWLNGGDRAKIREAIERFSAEITITVKCQIKRLSLICKRDAFINAFCSTHLITYFLANDMDRRLYKTFLTSRQRADALRL